jgi:hypothetical protein
MLTQIRKFKPFGSQIPIGETAEKSVPIRPIRSIRVRFFGHGLNGLNGFSRIRTGIKRSFVTREMSEQKNLVFIQL